jgi:quercetin dioxygenase-like cupin family protein
MKTGLLSPGGGRAVWILGDCYTVKASGEDTGGAFALVEALVSPGGGTPPHIHHREDEAFFVLEGELWFHADGDTFEARPGSWVTLARGSLHHFRNTGDDAARLLIVVTPSGLEQFFLEVGREAAKGDAAPVTPTPEEIEKLLSVAPKYGLEIQMPTPE